VCLEFAAADSKARAGMLTEAQARRVIGDIVEKTVGEPLAFHTAEAWLREWLAGKKQTKADGTYERYEHVIEDFITHLAKRASLNIAQLTPKDIRSFRDSEVALGKTGKTCNLAVKIVGSALNAARRQGFIQSNPAEALEPLPHTAEEKGMFTTDQVRDLIANAKSPEWRGAIIMGFYTGARLRDVANMTWNSIDLAARTIRFVPQKTKRTQKQVVIPIHPELHETLLEIAGQDNPNAPLFPSLARKGTGGAHGLSESFKAIMNKAGIKDEVARPRKGDKGRAISRLSFHSFRHGFNSMMANGGVAQEIRQKLTGHASAEMNAHYTHHEIESLRTAVKHLPPLTA
jgi:integrase